MKRSSCLLGSFLLLTATLSAQVSTNPPAEQLAPLGVNPVQAAEALQRAGARSMMMPNDTITLPPTGGLRDRFQYDSHRPDTALWDISLNPGVFVNRTWAIAPPDLGVCTFDGLDYAGQPYSALASPGSTGPCDELISRPINLGTLTPGDSLYLSFWYQAKGRGYAPNAQDSLIVDLNIPAWNPNSSTIIWKTVWFSEGFSPASNDSSFRIAMIRLDSASYFTNGFRFRFRNYASQCGSNDHWHIDEVYLDKQRSAADTLLLNVDFAYPASSGLAKYWAMPNTHYKSTMMAPNFNVFIRNNDTISTGRSVTYTHQIYDETGLYYQVPSPPTFPCPPYATSGYMNYAPISSPPINFSYDQSYVQSDTTTYIIKHILNSSGDRDTMVQLQKFYNYYAYDDGTAEVGYGLYGANSSLAYQFRMEKDTPDTLKAVQMYFLPVMDITNLQLRDFNLAVWANDGPAGAPGTVIYRQRNQHSSYSFETPDRFITYTIDSGTVVLQPGQTYYIGWQQLAPDRLYIGFDLNDNNQNRIYYNTSGNWNTSIFPGSLMMRPVFGEVYGHGSDVSGVPEQQPGAFALYPNPATDQLHIVAPGQSESYSAILIDLSGRVVMTAVLSGQAIDISSLNAGMYFVQLRNEKGEVIGTERLVISE